MGGRRLPSLRACVRICAGASNETCAALGMGSGVYATGMEADVEGIIGDMASSPGVVVHGRPVAPHQISRWHFNLGVSSPEPTGSRPRGPRVRGPPPEARRLLHRGTAPDHTSRERVDGGSYEG